MKFGFVDKFFEFAGRNPKLVGGFVLLLLLMAIYFNNAIGSLLAPYERMLQLVALVLSPLVTLLSFYSGYRSKLELIASTKTATELNERGKVLQREAMQAAGVVKQKEREIEDKQALIDEQKDKIEELATGAEDLWQRHGRRPFPEYREWLRNPEGAKVVMVGNLKGGVGKTTVASLLAAHASETMSKGVLVVDLDFQGSLSSLLMLGIGKREADSRAEMLLQEGDGLEVVSRGRIPLSGRFKRAWLIPANYTFARAENTLLFRYILQEQGGIDGRYRLAKILLDPRVANQFDLIIIDTPPRLTLGTVNALIASHFLVVPTVLDKLSFDAVDRFLRQVGSIKSELGLDLRLGGIVGTMTSVHPLRKDSAQFELWTDIGDIDSIWGEQDDFRLGIVPRRAVIANAVGEDIAYFRRDSNGDVIAELFAPIADRLFERMSEPVHS